MIHLLHFMPGKSGGVFDWFLELALRVATGDDVKPVAIPAVLGDAALV
jgi:hypothetical protein